MFFIEKELLLKNLNYDKNKIHLSPEFTYNI